MRPTDDLDLTPPPFSEGLDDWSQGDGTPDGPTYETAEHARIAWGDPDFGVCLEMRKVEAVQRLRYMGEMPVPRGGFLEVGVRIKALRGPMPLVQIAALPGGSGGLIVPDLPSSGPLARLCVYDAVAELAAVVGFEPMPGVDLVWDERALYAHVGLDLLGPEGGVVRIENLRVRDVTARFMPDGRRRLPGFEAADAR